MRKQPVRTAAAGLIGAAAFVAVLAIDKFSLPAVWFWGVVVAAIVMVVLLLQELRGY